MKKTFFITFAVTTALLTGCQQENDEVYSCDHRLDEWAHENLVSIRAMNREDWLHLDETYKKTAFNALTPEQKLYFWKTKLMEVMTTFEWNEAEIQHIMRLYQYLDDHPDLYTPESLNDSVQNERFARFAYQWKQEAMIELDWTEEQIFGISETGDRMIDRDGTYAVTIIKRNRTETETQFTASDCNCNTSRDPDCKSSGCTSNWGGTLYKIQYDGTKTIK